MAHRPTSCAAAGEMAFQFEGTVPVIDPMILTGLELGSAARSRTAKTLFRLASGVGVVAVNVVDGNWLAVEPEEGNGYGR